MATKPVKVALIESSKTAGHAGRGIGVYTENIKKYLPKFGIELVSIDQNPDLVHLPQFDYISFDWLKLLSKIPAIVTIHDVIPLEFPSHFPLGIRAKFNLPLNKLLLKQAKYIITDSYASVNSLHKYLNISHSKLKYIYLGVDPLFKPTKQRSKYPLPEKFVLYIGDVNWNKNLVSLSKACVELKTPLVIVGKNASLIESWNLDDPELLHLKELKILWKNKNFIRLGYVPYDELNKIMNQASVYCQVSYAEGFGLALLEAMACGTPLVVSNTHSLPEIGGDYPKYCDPNNLEDIKKKISLAIKEGRKKPSVPLSWEDTALKTSLIYNQALQS